MRNCKICGNELLTRQKNYCSNICKFSDKVYNARRVSKNKNDDTKILTSKLDGWETSDILNKSGSITKYLKSHNITTDNYLEYFAIADKPEIAKLSCPYCDWTTNDTNNSSGIFTRHILSSHNKCVSDFIAENPTFNTIWKTFRNNSLRLEHINLSTDNWVECQICHKKLKEITNTHLNLHGITCDEYKAVHGTLISETTRIEFSDNLRQVEFDSSSKAEREIREFLKSILPNSTFVYNSKNIIQPHELDIYISDKQVGIEYNGLYFHSEVGGGKYKDYHLYKTTLAENRGIQLIHIFEDEWKNKQSIVKNRLCAILGCISLKLDARNLISKPVSKIEKREFLRSNHIQGNDKSKVQIGLYNETMLVALMTFCALRPALGSSPVSDEWELSRFCCLSNYRIRGAFSKLVSEFEKLYKPIKIITYADRRWSRVTDNVYKNCGFIFVKNTHPNYFYTIQYKTRLHRFGFTKAKLIEKYGFSRDLTENVIMKNLRYDKIWDCGNMKFERLSKTNSRSTEILSCEQL